MSSLNCFPNFPLNFSVLGARGVRFESDPNFTSGEAFAFLSRNNFKVVWKLTYFWIRLPLHNITGYGLDGCQCINSMFRHDSKYVVKHKKRKTPWFRWHEAGMLQDSVWKECFNTDHHQSNFNKWLLSKTKYLFCRFDIKTHPRSEAPHAFTRISDWCCWFHFRLMKSTTMSLWELTSTLSLFAW